MNNQDKNIINDDLLAKYLAGNTTFQENASVDHWKNSNVENQRYFSDLELVWKKSVELNNEPNFNTDAAWQSVKNRISNNLTETKIIEINKNQTNYNFFIRIAAAIVVLVGFSIAYYVIVGDRNQENISEIKISTSNNRLNDTLPDGTKIFLNKNTTIAYNSNFGKGNREIRMNGEAFFDVMHQTENNFIVKAGDIEVRDIGTAFNIKMFNNSETEVIVSEGSVILKAEKDSILMVKGNKIKYNKQQKKLIKETNTDVNFDAYRTKTLVFDRTEMYKVVEILNDIYNANVEITDSSFKGCKLTATFKNESLDAILGIIKDTFSIRVTKTESGFKLEGNGCLN